MRFFIKAYWKFGSWGSLLLRQERAKKFSFQRSSFFIFPIFIVEYEKRRLCSLRFFFGKVIQITHYHFLLFIYRFIHNKMDGDSIYLKLVELRKGFVWKALWDQCFLSKFWEKREIRIGIFNKFGSKKENVKEKKHWKLGRISWDKEIKEIFSLNGQLSLGKISWSQGYVQKNIKKRLSENIKRTKLGPDLSLPYFDNMFFLIIKYFT